MGTMWGILGVGLAVVVATIVVVPQIQIMRENLRFMRNWEPDESLDETQSQKKEKKGGKSMPEEIGVFEVNEYDAVAAYYVEDAVAYYQSEIDDRPDAVYAIEDIEEVSKNKKVYKDENRDEMETIADVLDRNWNGKPFIVSSSD